MSPESTHKLAGIYMEVLMLVKACNHSYVTMNLIIAHKWVLAYSYYVAVTKTD